MYDPIGTFELDEVIPHTFPDGSRGFVVTFLLAGISPPVVAIALDQRQAAELLEMLKTRLDELCSS